MTRDEFMKELAYLLQDVEGDDKEDAVQYYMDYFEEAGPDQEEDVIAELGSPERIASIIRADIAGHLEEGGEFTERGYQDERFKDPGYGVAKRMDLPEQHENTAGGQGWKQGHQDGPHTESSGEQKTPAPRSSLILKVILWIVLIIVAAPMLLGIGGGILGLMAGTLGVLIALLVTLGIATAGVLIGGIVMVPYGIFHMFTHPLDGLMVSGTGIIFLGAGALCLALSILFYGRFVPFVIRGIVNSLNRLFHRRR